MDRIASSVDVSCIGFVHQSAIEVELLLSHLERVFGDPNHSLHIILLGFVRRMKNDHISPLRLRERREHQVCARYASSVDHFVHKKEVADEGRAIHG
jgi:hypothetical protein